MTKSPKINLVLDNVFAIKRWVRPQDWLSLAKDLGFNYVQASTDNEIDPLFSTPDYMDKWFDEAAEWQAKTGVKIADFYTGYQTYRTVGLAHYDEGMVRHIMEDWLFELIGRAGKAGIKGLGFCWFAIPEEIMQDPDRYYKMEERLIGLMAELGDYAWDNNKVQITYEQMYVPYQPPFTIAQSKDYLQRCYAPKKRPTYVTLDTGHMTGQRLFLKPTRDDILSSLKTGDDSLWLGGDELYSQWKTYRESGNFDEGADTIMAGLEKYPYLFAGKEDTDVYTWFEQLAKYSPFVHLQQTDGKKSAHLSFTPEHNQKGIITGEKLFAAIQKSYDSPEEIQPPAEEIYLSFELFYANTDDKRAIFRQLEQSLEYWRQFVPRDGMTASEILANIK